MPDDDPTQRAPDDATERETEMPTAMAPKMALVFHDDSETTPDFVLHLLERYCGKDEAQARAIVSEISERGRAVVGELPEAIAQIKLSQIQAAAKGKYPLKVTLDPLQGN